MDKETALLPGAQAEQPQGPEDDAATPAGDAVPGGEPGAKPEKHERFERKKPIKHWFKHKDVNNGAISFAGGLNIYKLIWIFVLASFLGVMIETLFVWSTTGEMMRRSGMIYGPFNQIYGFGAIIFALCLYRYRDKNAAIIFIAAGLIGMVFEYLCSVVQEMMFGSTSWDYSEMGTSIGGRTNLLYGVFWGALGLIFLNHMWPFMSEMIERIPNTFGKTLSVIVAVALAADLILSGMAVHRENERVKGLPATTPVARWLDEVFPDEVMREKYPSMEFSAAQPADGGTSAGSSSAGSVPAGEAG